MTKGFTIFEFRVVGLLHRGRTRRLGFHLRYFPAIARSEAASCWLGEAGAFEPYRMRVLGFSRQAAEAGSGILPHSGL